jgi:hypothetical protein
VARLCRTQSQKLASFPQEITFVQKPEFIWIEKFFKDLMLKESGIYTLWGSKPMTVFGMRSLTSSDESDAFSEEEIETAILLITKDELQTKWYQEIPQKMKDRAVILKNYTYDFHENWEKWKLLRKDINISKYLLCERENIRNCNLKTLVFVNILETAGLIQNNYDTFKGIVGYDFDPLSVIFELEEQSDFWDKVLSNSQLLGLLCGFGKRNVWCWHWKYRKYSEKTKAFQKTLHPSRSSDFDIYQIDKLSIDYFPIPSFVSFIEDDPVIKQYHREREKIKEIYQGKDFVTLTLKKLTEKVDGGVIKISF